jgi:hypothetical protein
MEKSEQNNNILSKTIREKSSIFSKIAAFKCIEESNGMSPTYSLLLDLKGQPKELYNKYMDSSKVELSKKFLN